MKLSDSSLHSSSIIGERRLASTQSRVHINASTILECKELLNESRILNSESEERRLAARLRKKKLEMDEICLILVDWSDGREQQEEL